MFPFVKILSSRSAAELTLDVNSYLNQLDAQNVDNHTAYSVKNLVFKVTALPDCGVMYSVMIVVADGSDYPIIEQPVNVRPEDIPF